jgi:hypothetical protein
MKTINNFRKNSKHFINIVLVVSIIIMTGCSTVNNTMQSWMGRSKSELYQSWGPPTRITDDGKGGEILIYERWIDLGQTSGRVYQHNDGSLSYTNPQQSGYTQTRMFYTDEYGKIYYWRWQGL